MWHLVLLILSLSSSNRVYGEPKVPCYFIFGDSLYDNGNNNDLDTLAKANYPPYGVDFPQGPSGRFTNGRTTTDLIAEHLGFDEYIPSFASAHGQEILKGVNYASGSAGILDETGQHLGARISLNNQIKNHQTTISRIETMKGKDSATNLLNKCMYTVGMGSNDYINNYLSNSYNTRTMYTPEQYATVLIQQYSQQLKKLYEYGARKVAVLGIGPLGCTPGNVALHGTNGSLCVGFINDAVELFNSKLISLVDEFNKDLHDAKFIYVNIYGMALVAVKDFCNSYYLGLSTFLHAVRLEQMLIQPFNVFAMVNLVRYSKLCTCFGMQLIRARRPTLSQQEDHTTLYFLLILPDRYSSSSSTLN
ncbi:hypothetical protein ACOSQ3_004108 [Xanthoceras sorbifolium]